MRQFIASRFRSVAGFSVVEMTTVLSAVTMLSGMAAPAVNDYLAEAKLVRARSDARVIAVSLVRMMNDVGAQGRRSGGWAQYDLLAGAGEAPVAATPASSQWSSDDRVGRLDDHLVGNQAGYASPASRGLGGWRGAYIDGPIAADPWGHRFAANVVHLATPGASDTVVLSAGPDGTANVPFTADGLRDAVDDVVVLISSGSY